MTSVSLPNVIPAGWMQAEGMNDPLHVELRHTTHLCLNDNWDEAYGRRIFKTDDQSMFQLADQKLIEGYANATEYAQEPMACFESAERLCLILVGDRLADQHQFFAFSNKQAWNDAVREMTAVSGYVLARINVGLLGVSHAYIFLSQKRKANDPLYGLIYQTNVGVQRQNRFDLDKWIDDPKSKTIVELGSYIQTIVDGFLDDAVKAYRDKYMLTGAGPDAEDADLKTLGKTDLSDHIHICCREVIEAKARKTLTGLREKLFAEDKKRIFKGSQHRLWKG